MPLRLGGLGGLGCCLGSLLTCWRSASFQAVEIVIFWGRENFGKKSKDFKKCDVIQFLHIFIWEVKGWFRADFVCFSAVRGLQGSTRAIYNAVFRWFSDLGELWRGSARNFGVLSGSGCRLAVGGGCWFRQAVRRSVVYMYIHFGILCHMLIFSIYLLYSLKYS